ncbi:uncharacterized protein LOC142625244 [Castanea sativa]|uniref:uncharacterized protein LOC142625244 n=1 Tax=Castanea sativa TaxID=21020 RepID=UPI003F649A34
MKSKSDVYSSKFLVTIYGSCGLLVNDGGKGGRLEAIISNNDRPPTNDHQKKDDQEESNAISRRNQQDTSCPSEPKIGALRMAQEMQTMKEKMDMMMNAIKGWVSTSLDELVHRIDSPFTALVTSFPLPAKFRMPQVEAYDGSKDPLDHLKSFKTLMHLQWAPDEIMCRAFPTTLKGPTRVWFSKIAPNIVSTFKELNGLFVTHFIGGQRYKRSSASLLNIKQGNNESLRSYVTQFNKEAQQINEVEDKVLVTAFTNGLQSRKFLFSVYKNDPKTMAGMLYRATKYMNAEDAVIARGGGPKKRDKHDDPRPERGRKVAKTGNRRDERRSRPPPGWMTNFTPLNSPLDQVLMQIKDDPALAWPDKLKGDLSKRPRNKYCCFHCDDGHDTFNCYDLKQQVEAFIRQEKLQRFVGRERAGENPPRDQELNQRVEERPRAPLGEIRVIVGGGAMIGSSRKVRKTYLQMVQNVQLTGHPHKLSRMDELEISFTEEDARQIHHPYDDVLVINLTIADFNTRRVLVDNGSSTDILYYPAFQQMRINKERLTPADAPLVGFGKTKVMPARSITLPVIIGTYP